MGAEISLCQLNIESYKHLDRIIPFLEKTRPDVLCVQELCERDIPLFEKALGARSVFAPMNRRTTARGPEIQGIGIFSSLPMTAYGTEYYAGHLNLDIDIDEIDIQSRRLTQAYALLWCDVERDGETFRIGTNHYTWTPNGQPSETQREDIPLLLAKLNALGEFVFCADLNAPRGNEIYERLSNDYIDAIPLSYSTSIDGTLHRSGPLPVMVDAILHTSGYDVFDVQQIWGLSDHCAFLAHVRKGQD